MHIGHLRAANVLPIARPRIQPTPAPTPTPGVPEWWLAGTGRYRRWTRQPHIRRTDWICLIKIRHASWFGWVLCFAILKTSSSRNEPNVLKYSLWPNRSVVDWLGGHKGSLRSDRFGRLAWESCFFFCWSWQNHDYCGRTPDGVVVISMGELDGVYDGRHMHVSRTNWIELGGFDWIVFGSVVAIFCFVVWYELMMIFGGLVSGWLGRKMPNRIYL